MRKLYHNVLSLNEIVSQAGLRDALDAAEPSGHKLPESALRTIDRAADRAAFAALSRACPMTKEANFMAVPASSEAASF